MQVRFFENGRIRTDQEACFFGSLDAINCLFKNTFALDTKVMRFFESVQMDVEEQPRCRFELMQTFTNEHAIRTKIDVFLSRQDLSRESAEVGINHRLAPAD